MGRRPSPTDSRRGVASTGHVAKKRGADRLFARVSGALAWSLICHICRFPMANDSSRIADVGLRPGSWPPWLRSRTITRTKLETTASFVLWVALSAVTLLWAVSSLWLPYGWDHGCFAYLSDTILRGGMPYRNALDFKGPLTFYIFAALQAVFGRQMWAIRAFDLMLLACAGVAGIRVGSRFVSRRAATCTMLVLVLAFASFGNWYTAQPDGWAALGLFVVIALLVRA